eukprot:TRINITY_DN43563_c0_g1_i1.p1 TRINITY_DN43563_c0_g1~~TRINITY_DN43563_c0_g1_i1.p1  ORF type:complete len:574 (+),score=71.69 TRINITY_DN43563_c0_g1_i1:116-1837(+)
MRQTAAFRHDCKFSAFPWISACCCVLSLSWVSSEEEPERYEAGVKSVLLDLITVTDDFNVGQDWCVLLSGHLITLRRFFVVGSKVMRAIAEHGLPYQVGTSIFVVPPGSTRREKIRVVAYTEGLLRESFDLSVDASRLVRVLTEKHALPDPELHRWVLVDVLEPPPENVIEAMWPTVEKMRAVLPWHALLADRAERYRHRHRQRPRDRCQSQRQRQQASCVQSHSSSWSRSDSKSYSHCTVTCDPRQCMHSHEFDLAFVLRPLWLPSEGHKPWLLLSELVVVNLGCRDFGPGDPLESLLAGLQRSGNGAGVRLHGLCVDGHTTSVETARQRLAAHPGVEVLEATITPATVPQLLARPSVAAQRRIDILQVDLDGFDAHVVVAALAVASPAVLILEYLWSVPPPFLYAQLYSVAAERTYRANPAGWANDGFYSASLSFFVGLLEGFGYLLYKMNADNTVWVHQSVAPTFEAVDSHLTFPVDEWACYLQTLFLSPNATLMPLSFMKEWFHGSSLDDALIRIRSNMTLLAPKALHFLDVAPPRAATSKHDTDEAADEVEQDQELRRWHRQIFKVSR